MPTTTFSKEFYQQQLVAGNNVTISTASGQPSTISASGGGNFVAGNNITFSTYSGQPTVISAVDTTYTNFYIQGPGLVPPVTTADSNSFLRGDGSWVGVDLSNHYVAGSNINISTASGQSSTISAIDTTYSAFTSSTSGLVPSPASSPANSYLKSDGSWSTISAGDSYIAGDNINISTVSGQPSTISAVNTTYADFSGSVSGLVPPATVSGDSGKYLKGDGTWATPSGGALANLSDVDLTSLANGQVLTYNSTSQKWENATGGGSGSTVSITPSLSTGTKIADFEIDGTSGELYAPNGGGGGGNVIDVYENGASCVDSNHIAQVKTHKEVTASEYAALTTAQKNNGILYLANGTTGVTVPIENISIGKYIENASCCQDEVSSNGKGVISYYYGGSQIGNDFWLLDKVDVTDYTYLKYDLDLGTCYGTYSANWYYTVGLMSSIPSTWIYAGDSGYAVKKSYTNQSVSYTDEALDVSNLTGEYYIVVVAHGWNATLDNIRLVSVNTQPNRIYFMSTEFANNQGGVTKEVLFHNTGTTNPSTITFTDALTDYDEIRFMLRAGSNAIPTMTYDTSTLVTGDTIGAGFYTGIFAWYYYTDAYTLTYRVDAGGGYISDIVGIKY